MAEEARLDEAERRRLAAALGLEKFAGLYPEAFDRAYFYSLGMQARVPEPAGIADEPAHVYRPAPQGEMPK